MPPKNDFAIVFQPTPGVTGANPGVTCLYCFYEIKCAKMQVDAARLTVQDDLPLAAHFRDRDELPEDAERRIKQRHEEVELRAQTEVGEAG